MNKANKKLPVEFPSELLTKLCQNYAWRVGHWSEEEALEWLFAKAEEVIAHSTGWEILTNGWHLPLSDDDFDRAYFTEQLIQQVIYNPMFCD